MQIRAQMRVQNPVIPTVLTGAQFLEQVDEEAFTHYSDTAIGASNNNYRSGGHSN